MSSLGIEEEDGEGQEGQVKQRECAMDGMEMTCECAQNLSHEVCGVIIKCGTVRAMCRLTA